MLLTGEQVDESWPLKLAGINHLYHLCSPVLQALDNNPLDCSSCDLEALKVFLNK